MQHPLQPYSASVFETLAALEPLRLKRILDALKDAARSHHLFHMNWHPHNFGLNLDANLRVLRSILECYAHYRDSDGMRALSMKEVVEALKGGEVHAEPAVCEPTERSH